MHVKADGDHVRSQAEVDGVLLRVFDGELLQSALDLWGVLSPRELNYRVEIARDDGRVKPAFLKQALWYVAVGPRQGLAELARGPVVTDNGPVRITQHIVFELPGLGFP